MGAGAEALRKDKLLVGAAEGGALWKSSKSSSPPAHSYQPIAMRYYGCKHTELQRLRTDRRQSFLCRDASEPVIVVHTQKIYLRLLRLGRFGSSGES